MKNQYKRLDLNTDIGERLDEPKGLLSIVTSANIACGGHSGKEQTMAAMISECLARGVRTAAHPSFPDRERFGRVSMEMPPSALIRAIVDQVSQLREIGSREGAEIAYLKPHGALYNDAARGGALGSALIEACLKLDLDLLCLADAPLEAMAKEASVNYIREGFADRRYTHGGELVSRSQPHALILDPGEAAAQASRIANNVESVCIHSDTPGAVQIAAAVRRRLEDEGWEPHL